MKCVRESRTTCRQIFSSTCSTFPAFSECRSGEVCVAWVNCQTVVKGGWGGGYEAESRSFINSTEQGKASECVMSQPRSTICFISFLTFTVPEKKATLRFQLALLSSQLDLFRLILSHVTTGISPIGCSRMFKSLARVRC